MSRERYRSGDHHEDEPWRERPRRRRSRQPEEGFHREGEAERRRRPAEDLFFIDEEEVSFLEEPAPPRHPEQSRGRRRTSWLWFLGGCGVAVLLLLMGAVLAVFVAVRNITGTNPVPILGPTVTNYTQQSQQSIAISNLTQLKITSQVGAIQITTDASLNAPQLSITRHTRASSQAEADSEFRRMNVMVQPAPESLSVTATLPQGNNLTSTSDAIDLRFSLPASVNQGNAPFQLNIDLAVGAIDIHGLNGVLIVKDDAGNISVEEAELADGSNLRTANGVVSFQGTLNTTPLSGAAPLFQIHSEVGRLNIALPPSTAVRLDANVNNGTISSTFPIQVSTNDNSASYYGPLIPGSSPTAILRLDVGSGSITLRSA